MIQFAFGFITGFFIMAVWAGVKLIKMEKLHKEKISKLSDEYETIFRRLNKTIDALNNLIYKS